MVVCSTDFFTPDMNQLYFPLTKCNQMNAKGCIHSFNTNVIGTVSRKLKPRVALHHLIGLALKGVSSENLKGVSSKN